MEPRLLAFIGVSALLIAAPGPDMVLVTRNGLRHGRSAALATGLGVNVGLVCWALATALGLAALLRASSEAFTVVRLAGAAYLLWLGLTTLLDAWRGRGSLLDVKAARARAPISPRAAFLSGAANNLLNPKAAVIYTTLFPQFVARGAAPSATLLLAAVFSLIALGWYVGYALAIGSAGRVLARRRVRLAVETVAGLAMVALGGRIALERR